jgi:hypothetical protein
MSNMPGAAMPTTAKVRTNARAAAPGAKKSASSSSARTAAKAAPRPARVSTSPTGPGTGTGKAKKKSTAKPDTAGSPSALIDARIRELGDWRGEMLARLRALVHEADPEVVEEWKWRGTPVWSHGGLICTGETYQQVVKMTFAKGASVADPSGLFNASLEGNTRRAIDFKEGDEPDAKALKALIRAAVALNETTTRGRAAAKAPARKTAAAKAAAAEVATGPQGPAPGKARKPASLPKSDGDAGVQAYIASLEPWQAELARRVDTLVAKHVPGLRKGVRWHCPFYGVEGQGWFLAFAAFQRHVKFTFFQGRSLDPAPPLGEGKEARSLDLREPDALDEKQWTAWLRQAAALPGWDGGATRSGGSAA